MKTCGFLIAVALVSPLWLATAGELKANTLAAEESAQGWILPFDGQSAVEVREINPTCNWVQSWF